MKIKFAVMHKFCNEVSPRDIFDTHQQAEYAISQVEQKYREDYIMFPFPVIATKKG